MITINKKNLNEGRIGQVFTPDYVAEFMVKNVFQWYERTNKLHENKKGFTNIKVLEPAAGEGVFLKYLIKRSGSLDITAYEIDLSLKEKLIKQFPRVKFKFKNFLFSERDEKYNIIIGNPPYLGQNYNSEYFQNIVKKSPNCAKYFVGNMDLFYFFIHLGIERLTPGGFLSFITTNYWINKSKKTGVKLLKPHITKECFLVQYIDLSNLNVFDSISKHDDCIFTLQKKTKEEIRNNVDKNIEIIKIKKKKSKNISMSNYNKLVFNQLIKSEKSEYFDKYISALTNKELKANENWNLIYPVEIKKVVKKIENYCSKKGIITRLGDIFAIRNGLILIKDDIFILKEGYSLKIEENAFFIKIQDKFIRLNPSEVDRLKKLYKSRVIVPYGFMKDDHEGFLIYFNKNENSSLNDSNLVKQYYKKKYPNLIRYLDQFHDDLKSILINAKENPLNIYFPRRGCFIRLGNKQNELVDLEPYYDKEKKIFFKFVSKRNMFGFSDTSYYATSDTYFLWPKIPINEIDYYFLLAYLNSKIIKFIFKAKNLTVKRSKTKLEQKIPIPNIELFSSYNDLTRIEFIRKLSRFLTLINKDNNYQMLNELISEILEIKNLINLDNKNLEKILKKTLKSKEIDQVQEIIDDILINLFNLKEEELDYLMQKYYTS